MIQFPIGRKVWAIPEGYLPDGSHGPESEFISPDTVIILNPNREDAQIELLIYFADREPVGPYHLMVPARRVRHFRLTDLKDPQPIPKAIEYATVIESSVPVILQQIRLDSRQTETALISMLGFGGNV